MKPKVELGYADFALKWLEERKPFIKSSSYAAYATLLFNHLLPYWGEWDVAKIQEHDVQEFILRLAGPGGDVFSESYLRGIVGLLINILRDAARQRQAPIPFFRLHYPAQARGRRPMAVLSPSQREQLTAAVFADFTPCSCGILLALHTGLRIGELCALKWSSIDLDEGLVHVRQTMQRVYLKEASGRGHTELLFGQPKSRSAEREIPLSRWMVETLHRLPAAVGDAFLLSGTPHCVEVRTYRSSFGQFLKRHQLTHFHFHVLRHTFASRCIECGADPKTVSELLGHSTIAMTMNRYVHPRIEQKRQCVEAISR